MKRGPYKLYLTPEGDGILPRSTFYRHLKKFRSAVTLDNSHVGSQNICDQETKANNPLNLDAVPEHGNLSSETVDRTEVSYIHDLNFERSSSNSWLYEDYDDESLLEEIWFDAEDLSLTDDFYVDYNNEHNQYLSSSSHGS
ncbi:uncharacterized protein LOC123266052 [Cotesia glomerata]|uniref:uncharacterized protein LOC123266052 n=1 Tax=Cotesia glomerata TaxID=32391 RepID=UPI001D03074B|nr:uncharacterized protein LOC123266052 [Cotesia glomerata]